MGESLTVRRRVEDEGLRIVNSCHVGEMARARILLWNDSTTGGRDG
jgi:hypothetical protein